MDRVIGQTAPWYRALTLIERIPDSGTIREDSDTYSFNQDLAERKMQRWYSHQYNRYRTRISVGGSMSLTVADLENRQAYYPDYRLER